MASIALFSGIPLLGKDSHHEGGRSVVIRPEIGIGTRYRDLRIRCGLNFWHTRFVFQFRPSARQVRIISV